MSLGERVTRDLTASMKARDALRTGVLRMAKAAFKNREIEKRGALDESEQVKLLQTLVKQREEAAEQYVAGKRPELADKERAEAAVLREYLPAEASPAEIAEAVERAIADTGASAMKDIGQVMKAALAVLREGGKSVDGKLVNAAARARLGG